MKECVQICECAANFIDQYQSLIAGVLSFLATIILIFVTNNQTQDQLNQMQGHREADLQGKRRAARAALPLTLNQICDWATDYGQKLQEIWGENHNLHEIVDYIQSTDELREFPYEVISTLERNIEYAPEEVSERLSSIVREVQILLARSVKIRPPLAVHQDHMAHLIEQCVSIHARASTLFLYARGKPYTWSKQTLWNQCVDSARQMRIHRVEVSTYMNDKIRQGLPPGEADTPEPEA